MMMTAGRAISHVCCTMMTTITIFRIHFATFWSINCNSRPARVDIRISIEILKRNVATGLLHQIEYAEAYSLNIVRQIVRGLKSELTTASDSEFTQKRPRRTVGRTVLRKARSCPSTRLVGCWMNSQRGSARL